MHIHHRSRLQCPRLFTLLHASVIILQLKVVSQNINSERRAMGMFTLTYRIRPSSDLSDNWGRYGNIEMRPDGTCKAINPSRGFEKIFPNVPEAITELIRQFCNIQEGSPLPNHSLSFLGMRPGF